jgi:hypothetical protein
MNLVPVNKAAALRRVAIMHELRKWCLKQQAGLQRQLKAFEDGMRTCKNHLDTTRQERLLADNAYRHHAPGHAAAAAALAGRT